MATRGPPDPFIAHCAELLGIAGHVRTRRMFGGHGFYVDDVFVAVAIDECLYLKVDAATRPSFEAAGGVPFTFESTRGTVTVNYVSVPEEALDSPPAMQPWVRLAIDAALRARARKVRPDQVSSRSRGTRAK